MKNISNDIFSKLNESAEDSKERLQDMAYNFCSEVGSEADLEYVIKEMKWWLEERKRQNREDKISNPGKDTFPSDMSDDALRKHLKGLKGKGNATKRAEAKDEIKRRGIKEAKSIDEFDPEVLIDNIISMLKDTSGIKNVTKSHEDYSVISGDYIYFDEYADDGEVYKWVLALGEDDHNEE
ncbi:MAG: hypothetical protein J6T15_04975 [Bacilli bacterium]|nr:hypothetical protein [Bacilli bacterium]